jgi:hypothetical protein
VASWSSPTLGFQGRRRITTSRHEVAGRCVEGGDLAGNASALLGELEVRLLGKAAVERDAVPRHVVLAAVEARLGESAAGVVSGGSATAAWGGASAGDGRAVCVFVAAVSSAPSLAAGAGAHAICSTGTVNFRCLWRCCAPSALALKLSLCIA